MLGFNFEKNMPKKFQIYFIAVALISEARQKKGELNTALFAEQLKAGA